MKRESSSKTSLFLMEMIISILFFAIVGAVCIRLFVSAHLLAKESADLSQATLIATDLAESYLGLDGNMTDLAGLYTDALSSEESLLLFYDEDWNPSSKDNAAYEALLESSGISMKKASITIFTLSPITIGDSEEISENDLIYTLQVQKYLGGKS